MLYGYRGKSYFSKNDILQVSEVNCKKLKKLQCLRQHQIQIVIFWVSTKTNKNRRQLYEGNRSWNQWLLPKIRL